MNFWTAVISLFLVINIIGNIPLFVGLLARFKVKRQRMIIFREMCFSLVILLLFGIFGTKILTVLQIDQTIIEISGGFLLILVAIRMIFPSKDHVESMEHEPMLIPLAVPTVTGPGSITTTIVIQQAIGNVGLVLGVIFIAWFVSLIIILAASNIKYFLGEKGMIGFERFGGMMITLIAVHMLVHGIVEVVKTNFPG